MAASKIFEDVQAKLESLFAGSPAKDLERNVKTLVGNTFARLDLATREEMDIQAKVLARTRERLEALEARVAELEARLGAKTGSGDAAG